MFVEMYGLDCFLWGSHFFFRLKASLPLWIDGFKSSAPVLVPVAKAVVAFPFVFHTVSVCKELMMMIFFCA